MINLRPAAERGRGQFGWLEARYTFSFGDFHDPHQMGFRALRVMNEDRIAPGRGFGEHGHRDMEILTYVLEGSLAHRDSLGNGAALRPGELQSMTAGSGIRHSEFNASTDEPVHLYQVWLLPDRPGLPPRYDQRTFAEAERRGRFRVVASPDGRDGSLLIHQDAEVFLATLEPGESANHAFAPGRHGWLQVLRGSAQLNGKPLSAGDGAALSDEPALTVNGDGPCEVMLFDLP